MNIFGDNHTRSKLLRSLKDKLYLEYAELNPIERVAEYRDVCAIERLSDVDMIIQVIFTQHSNENFLVKFLILLFSIDFRPNFSMTMVLRSFMLLKNVPVTISSPTLFTRIGRF